MYRLEMFCTFLHRVKRGKGVKYAFGFWSACPLSCVGFSGRRCLFLHVVSSVQPRCRQYCSCWSRSVCQFLAWSSSSEYGQDKNHITEQIFLPPPWSAQLLFCHLKILAGCDYNLMGRGQKYSRFRDLVNETQMLKLFLNRIFIGSHTPALFFV